MSWAALHTRSYYSLLHSINKPVKIAERAVQVGLPAIALTDEGSITGSVAFMKALKNTCQCGHHKNSHGDNVCYGNNKKCTCTASANDKDFPSANIKPILGSEIKIRDGHGSGIIVIAKNLLGWKKLISITSEANKVGNIHRDIPTLTLEQLSEFCDGNVIGISGYPGSDIANELFDEPASIYFAKDYSEGRSFSSVTNYKKAIDLAGKWSDVFGKGNFYLEVQRMNKDTFPGGEVIANATRCISKAINIPCVAGADAFYCYPDDFDDQRLLICSDLDSTYNNVDIKISTPEHAWLKNFFTSRKYYIPSPEEITPLYELEEINHSLEIAEQCEKYSILSKPILPLFDCPDGKTPDQHLKDICAKSWKEKISPILTNENNTVYKSQIKEELEVLQNAGLSSYFLIVEDYCRAAREQGQLLGNGRGSAAGSLVAYLTNITKTDPVKYGLMFERFYNAGRNTADRVSLPDIDTDFEDRDAAIAYITKKYGEDRVGQMVTFSRILGKGSIKEVFRIRYPNISTDEVNEITKALPDDFEIADKLQEMKEAGEEPSIIMWALEAKAKELKQYCYIDNNGMLQGEYAPAFKQAIRLEGTKKSQSKHPSGLVISNTRLADLVPMVYDKSSKKSVAGMEMADLEDMGIPKFDILQIDVLKKLHGVARIIATGEIDDNE